MVHGLMHKLLNDNEKVALLSGIEKIMKPEDVQWIKSEYEKIYGGKDVNPEKLQRLIQEEMVGKFIERSDVNELLNYSPFKKFVNKIIRFIKDKFGIEYNEKDITNLIKEAITNYRDKKLTSDDALRPKAYADYSVDSPYVTDYEKGVVFPKYSIRTLNEFMDDKKSFEQWKQDLISNGWSEEKIDKFIKDTTNLTAIALNNPILDLKTDRSYSAVKTNSDHQYGVSVEFSTFCRKTIGIVNEIAEIQNRLGRGLTANEMIQVREMLDNKNEQVPCANCYVFSRWMTWGKINENMANKDFYLKNYSNKKTLNDEFKKIKKAINVTPEELNKLKETYDKKSNDGKNLEIKPIIFKHLSEKYTPEQIAKLDKIPDYVQKKVSKTLGKKWDNIFKGIPKDYIYDWTKIDKLRKEFPNAFKWRSKRGSSAGKMPETRTEYVHGELAKHFKTETSVKVQNLFSGVRQQSWSDFEPQHTFDLIQAIMELSQLRLASHAYTKVSDFVEIAGNSGVMINLSLIPERLGLDENGELVFSDTEGMPFEKALELRNKYSKTTGTIAIGVTDAQIRKLMESDNIDYIIPYHASGLKKDALKQMLKISDEEIEQYKDYTAVQEDDVIDRAKAEARINRMKDKHGMNNDQAKLIMSHEWFDPKADGLQNGKNFLNYCKENGYKPRFEEFAYLENGEVNPNYYKLLIDRKMYDNSGKAIIQKPVKPNINMEEVQRIFDEVKTGKYKLAREHYDEDIVSEFVKSKKDEKGDVKYSVSEPEKKPLPEDADAMRKLIKEFVEKKSNVTLDDVVGFTKDFFPELSDKQIYDVISNRKPIVREKKKTEAEKTFKELQKQALYKSKIEDALKGIVEAYKEKKEPSAEVRELQDNLTLLKNNIYKTVIDPQQVDYYKSRIDKLIDDLYVFRDTGESPKKRPKREYHNDIMNMQRNVRELSALLRTEEKLKKLKDLMDENNMVGMVGFVTPKPRKKAQSDILRKKQLELHYQKRKLIAKVNDMKIVGAFNKIKKIGSTLTVAMFSGDTALFRQGQYAMSRRPFETLKDFGKSMKLFGTAIADMSNKGIFTGEKAEKMFSDFMFEIQNSHHWHEYLEVKLAITDPAMGMMHSEELFLFTNWIEKVPIKGKIVQGSELAYTMFQNLIRLSWYESLRKENMTMEEKKYIAQFVNSATGRGNLAGLEKSATGLSTFLLAPRFYASQIDMMGGMIFTEKFRKSKTVRNEWLKTMGTYFAHRIAFMAMCSAGGGEVEWKDIDDPAWMKVKFGKEIIDPFGGQNWIPKMFLSGLIGSTSYSLGIKNPLKRTFSDLFYKNLKNKANPLLAMGMQAASAKKHDKSQATLAADLLQAPLSLIERQILDAYNNNTLEYLPLSFSLEFLGVNNYVEKKKNKRKKSKTKISY
jgi:hypothetical protein